MFSSDALKENIRKKRLSLSLSQAELAEKLGVSVQAVSKWERGLCLPELSAVYELSRIFSVSVDSLIESKDGNSEGAFISIDGGGTKTEFLLFLNSGAILGRLVLASSNPNAVGLDSALSVFKSGIDSLISKADGKISGIYIGSAGMLSGDNREKTLNFLKENYPSIPSEVATDIYNVIYSAVDKEKCLAVIAGTGSVVYAKVGDEIHRFGGWGYLLDDGGSGYDLGCALLRAVLSANEGMGETTVLKPLLEERLGGDVFSKIPELYSSAPASIAALSPIVFLAFKLDDPVAKRIVNDTVTKLAKRINAAREKYSTGDTVVISGGLVAEGEIWIPILLRELSFAPEIIIPNLPQIFGASKRAAALFGDKDALSSDVFAKEYEKFR